MRVVGDHEHLVARDRHATVVAASRVAHQIACARALVVPDHAAVACIQRVAFVGVGDEHQTFGNKRRALERGTRGEREAPTRSHLADVELADLRHRGEAVAGDGAVVGGPVDFGGHFAELAAVQSPQQVDFLVVTHHLHVRDALVDDRALHRLAVRELGLQLVLLETDIGRFQHPKESRELGQLRSRNIEGRHALPTLRDDRGNLGVG